MVFTFNCVFCGVISVFVVVVGIWWCVFFVVYLACGVYPLGSSVVLTVRASVGRFRAERDCLKRTPFFVFFF